jgi:hypothetical protein
MVTLSASLRFVYVDPAFSNEDFRVVDDGSRLALLAVLADVLEDPCAPQFPLADSCP